MKIKIRKSISIILQVLGVLFLLQLSLQFSLRFYYSFDKKLQKNQWNLISVSDSLGNINKIEGEEQFKLVFKDRHNLSIIQNSCGEYKFKYQIGAYHTFTVDNTFYISLGNCFELNHKKYYYKSNLERVIYDSRKYQIRNDTLWVIVNNYEYANFTKAK